MSDFTARLRAGAVAAWWTVLVAVGFAILLFAAYRILMSARPAWLLAMWGPELTWPELQRMFLWIIIAFRFLVWVFVLVAVWLSLWARQLKKQEGNPANR